MTEDRKPEELDPTAPEAPETPEAPGASGEDSAVQATPAPEPVAGDDAPAPAGGAADTPSADAADGADADGDAGGAGGTGAAGDSETSAPEADIAPRPETAAEAASGAESGGASEAAPGAKDDGDGEELQEMGLLGHLEELRIRLTRAAIAVVLGACVSYAFAEHLYRFIIDPLMPFVSGGHLIYTSPAEGFITYIKLAAVAGIFLTSPYSFYQMWAFIAPGLYKEEKRYIAPLAMASAMLFVGGALFSYYKVTPLAYEFFSSFDNEFMVMLPSVKESLAMGLKLLFAFGIAFELPLVIFFLARLGVVSSAGLRRSRKYAVLGAFIVGALLTPPDPASQCLMAIPLVLLYEIGIWLAHFFGKKTAPAAEEEEAAA